MEENQKTLVSSLDEKTMKQKNMIDELGNSVNILTQSMEQNQEFIDAMKHKLDKENIETAGELNKRKTMGVNDNILNEDIIEKVTPSKEIVQHCWQRARGVARALINVTTGIQTRCKTQQRKGNQNIFRHTTRKIKKKFWKDRVSI
eukprot:10434625-Ditylum_brightwellii.AAC.1